LDDRRSRKRSAAFPFELPFRLINMFSVKGDTVLDPFAGVGTTMHAAMATERNSVMVEKDARLAEALQSPAKNIIGTANERTKSRLDTHRAFIAAREQAGGALKHINRFYGFPVVTRQEVGLVLPRLETVVKKPESRLAVHYRPMTL